jgi:hypothetical protein
MRKSVLGLGDERSSVNLAQLRPSRTNSRACILLIVDSEKDDQG